RDADLAHSYRAVGITVLRRRNCQIFGPSRHFAKLPDCLCRYLDVRIDLDRHLSRQATESYVKRSTALGLISHEGLRTLTTDCGKRPTISQRCWPSGKEESPFGLTPFDSRFCT